MLAQDLTRRLSPEVLSRRPAVPVRSGYPPVGVYIASSLFFSLHPSRSYRRSSLTYRPHQLLLGQSASSSCGPVSARRYPEGCCRILPSLSSSVVASPRPVTLVRRALLTAATVRAYPPASAAGPFWRPVALGTHPRGHHAVANWRTGGASRLRSRREVSCSGLDRSCPWARLAAAW